MPPKRKNSDNNTPLKKSKLEVFTDPQFLSKKYQYLQLCRDDPKYFVNGPIEMKNDRDCAYATLCVNEFAFNDVSSEIARDIDFLVTILKENPRLIERIIVSKHYYGIYDDSGLKFPLSPLLQKCSKEVILTLIPYFSDTKDFILASQTEFFQSDMDSRCEIIRAIVEKDPENFQYLDPDNFQSTLDKEFFKQLIFTVIEKLDPSSQYTRGNLYLYYFYRLEPLIDQNHQHDTDILDAIIKRGVRLNQIESIKWTISNVKQKTKLYYRVEMELSVEFPRFPQFWRLNTLKDETILYLARMNGHILFQFCREQKYTTRRIFDDEAYICAILSCPELFFYPYADCGTLPIAEKVLNRDTSGNFAKLLVSLKDYTNVGFNIELMNLARRVRSYGTNPIPNTKQFGLLKRGKLHDTYFSFVRC